MAGACQQGAGCCTAGDATGGAAERCAAAEAAVQRHGGSAALCQHHHCEGQQQHTGRDLLWAGQGSGHLPGHPDCARAAELVSQHRLVQRAVEHAAPADGPLPVGVPRHHPPAGRHRPVAHAGLLPAQLPAGLPHELRDVKWQQQQQQRERVLGCCKGVVMLSSEAVQCCLLRVSIATPIGVRLRVQIIGAGQQLGGRGHL